MQQNKECLENCMFAGPNFSCAKPPEGVCPLEIYGGAASAPKVTIKETGKTVQILGSLWIILERSEVEDERLKDCDGYCDWTTREIVVEREVCGNLGDMEAYIRKVTRHEIVHAFLLESGLHECAGEVESWAANEEMVDWIARQGPKIYAAWKEAGALDG